MDLSDDETDETTSVIIDEMSKVLDIVRSENTDASKLSHICVAKYLLSGNSESLESGPVPLSPEVVQANKDTVEALNRLGSPTVTATGPLCIPVATVDDDNKELIFGRPGIPVCSKGDDCQAHFVPGHPNLTLNAYRGPGHDPSSNKCLLCVRHDIAMIVAHHRTHRASVPLGLLPPFQNLANCVGGYRSSFCAVTPNDMDIISGGVHICGAPVGMKKTYDPYHKRWMIDQSVAVYGSRQDFFF